MKRNHIGFIVGVFILAMSLAACQKAPAELENKDEQNISENIQNKEAEETVNEETFVNEGTEAVANEQADAPVITEWGIALPYEVEDGKLELSSIFQSDIPNPDNNLEEGINLASIEIVNKSSEYLKSAEITIVLEEQEILNFSIYDIPAGETVWAFDKNGRSVEEACKCLEIHCEAEFEQEDSEWKDNYLVKTEAAIAEITNVTDQEKSDIKVIIHNKVDGIYLGGMSYEYQIEKLLPQESVPLEVVECFFGDVSVVRIIN